MGSRFSAAECHLGALGLVHFPRFWGSFPGGHATLQCSQYTMSYSTLLYVQVRIQGQGRGQQSTFFRAQPSKGTPGMSYPSETTSTPLFYQDGRY
jgi:hypothetical protein